jgi:hypothetical protein
MSICCCGVNVRDYGAKGDGSSDDWFAIMAAIATLPPSGGVLCFPPGTYLSSGPVYIANRSAFRVVGYGATIRIADNQSYDRGALPPLPPPLLPLGPRAYNSRTPQFSVVEVLNCQDWQLEGLTLDGNCFKRGVTTDPDPMHVDDYNTSCGLDISACRRFRVESVEVLNCFGHGIALQPVDVDTPGFPQLVTEAKLGQPCSNCRDFVLRDITVHDSGANALAIWGAHHGLIDGLADYNMAVDPDYRCSYCSTIHFEITDAHRPETLNAQGIPVNAEGVPTPRVFYGRAEWLTVRNVHGENHGDNFANPNIGRYGKLFHFSTGSQFITVDGFSYLQDRHRARKPGTPQRAITLSTAAPVFDEQAMIVLGGERPVSNNIVLANGILQTDDHASCGIWLVSGDETDVGKTGAGTPDLGLRPDVVSDIVIQAVIVRMPKWAISVACDASEILVANCIVQASDTAWAADENSREGPPANVVASVVLSA